MVKSAEHGGIIYHVWPQHLRGGDEGPKFGANLGYIEWSCLKEIINRQIKNNG